LIRRLFIFGGALGLLVLAASSDPVHEFVTDAVRVGAALIERHPNWGPVIFVVLSGAAAMLAFFSTVPLLPVAVFAWGEWPTFFLLWISWWLGGAVSYVLGRTLGPRVAHWFAKEETLARYETRLKRRTGFATVFIFQLALPSEIPGYVLGTLRYPFRTYALELAAAELPYALSSIFLSGSFLSREYTVLVLVGMAVIGLSALSFWGLRRTLGDTAEPQDP
jgi:uncharacterized membrane protein YdjX (TVP38/TMEM64 family)